MPTTVTTTNNLLDLIHLVASWVSAALPLVMGLALLGFFWGLAQFIFKAGDEEAQKEGRRLMVWGVIALFVMISVWGIVKFVGDSLGIGTGGNTGVVQVPISS